jgi:phosphatidylglycerophosphatase A
MDLIRDIIIGVGLIASFWSAVIIAVFLYRVFDAIRSIPDNHGEW